MIRPAAGLGLTGVLLALPALIAFQVAQSARARVPGWIGTVLLVLGLAALEIPHLVMGLFDPSSLYDLDAYHASTFGAMEFYGVVALAVGHRQKRMPSGAFRPEKFRRPCRRTSGGRPRLLSRRRCR